MEGVIKGVQYCQFEKAAAINNGIYDRNLPSGPLHMNFEPRSTPTRYVKMPILECRLPTNVSCKNEVIYNPYTTFNPGTSAPFSGFANGIDQESRLQNRFFPLQKGAQPVFIPSSHSDLYEVSTPSSQHVKMSHQLLFKQEQFNPVNVNKCGLGEKLFNNHTRFQVRNLKRKIST
jgi:hypothetical protein